MNGKQVFACTLCYSTYPTVDEANNCALNSCNVVETKYECEECQDYWPTLEEANWCCSEADTLGARAQYDNSIFGDIEEPDEDENADIF